MADVVRQLADDNDLKSNKSEMLIGQLCSAYRRGGQQQPQDFVFGDRIIIIMHICKPCHVTHHNHYYYYYYYTPTNLFYSHSSQSVGLHGLKRMVIFTSEDAHYSVQKLASFMGIGSANVYAIRTDPETGKLSIEHLEKEIERVKAEDAVPLMVSATAGTTVLGAFDPLPEIADLCAKHKMWMHVDAAWGGGALVSQKYRKLLQGIER